MPGPARVSKRRRRWKSFRQLDTGIRAWLRRSRRAPTESAAQPHLEYDAETNDDQPPPPLANDSSHSDMSIQNNVADDVDNGVAGEMDEERGDTDHQQESSNHPREEYLSNQESDHQPSGNVPIFDVLIQAETSNADTGHAPSSDDCRADIVRLMSGLNLSAITIAVGTSLLTVQQYNMMRLFFTYFVSGQSRFPSYNTLLYTILPLLRHLCFAPHIILAEVVNLQAAGVSPALHDELNSETGPMERFLVTFPSGWLHRDARELRNHMQSIREDSVYPKIAAFQNSVLDHKGACLNSDALFCEYEVCGAVYNYGVYIFEGDTIKVSFITRNRPLRDSLLQHGFRMGNGGTLTIYGSVSSAKMTEEGQLGEELADICIPLETADAHIDEAVLQFHVGSFAQGWPSSLRLSIPDFPSETVRLRSISLVQPNATQLSQLAPAVGVLEDGRPYMRVPYILFTDDFSSMGGRGGSSGGCYMAPMIASVHRGGGMRNVRALCLTPPGVSSNDPAFRRTKHRMRLIRKGAGGNVQKLRTAGLQPIPEEASKTLPLHLLL